MKRILADYFKLIISTSSFNIDHNLNGSVCFKNRMQQNQSSGQLRIVIIHVIFRFYSFFLACIIFESFSTNWSLPFAFGLSIRCIYFLCWYVSDSCVPFALYRVYSFLCAISPLFSFIHFFLLFSLSLFLPLSQLCVYRSYNITSTHSLCIVHDLYICLCIQCACVYVVDSLLLTIKFTKESTSNSTIFLRSEYRIVLDFSLLHFSSSPHAFSMELCIPVKL